MSADPNVIVTKGAGIFRKRTKDKSYRLIAVEETIDMAISEIKDIKQPGDKYFISPGLGVE